MIHKKISPEGISVLRIEFPRGCFCIRLSANTQAAQNDGNDHGKCRKRCTGHKDIDVRIFMSQTADTQQGDNGAVMRQGVQTAAGDGSNSVKSFRAEVRIALSQFHIFWTKGFQRRS